MFLCLISSISLRDKDLPVPSYPLIVLAINTLWGPKNDLTYGRGIAAA